MKNTPAEKEIKILRKVLNKGESITDVFIAWGVEALWPLPKEPDKFLLLFSEDKKWRVALVVHTLRSPVVLCEYGEGFLGAHGELAAAHYHLMEARLKESIAEEILTEAQYATQEAVNNINQLEIKHHARTEIT